MQEAEAGFDISKIPGVDLTCGGQLRPGGHRIARILRSDKDEISRWQSLRLTLKAMQSAGLSWGEIAAELFRLASVYLQASVPHDTEVCCPTNPKAEKVIMHFLGNFLRKESGIEGMENLVHAMELNAQGESVQFYSMPHQSATEPVFLKILLQREAEKTSDGEQRQAAESMLQQLVVMIGQRVLHSRFRRAFSEAVNAVFTVPPKYRVNLKNQQKALLTAHSKNITRIINHMRSNPQCAVLIFPEGGFTRNQQIGFQAMTAQVPPETHIVPIYTESPEGLLRPELGDAMHMDPSAMRLYVGKPFQLEPGSIRARLGALVTTCRNNVDAIGAPIRERAWGYMRRNRQANTGQTFVPIT